MYNYWIIVWAGVSPKHCSRNLRVPLTSTSTVAIPGWGKPRMQHCFNFKFPALIRMISVVLVSTAPCDHVMLSNEWVGFVHSLVQVLSLVLDLVGLLTFLVLCFCFLNWAIFLLGRSMGTIIISILFVDEDHIWQCWCPKALVVFRVTVPPTSQ